MNQQFSVFEVILFVGIIQGCVISILIFLQKPLYLNKKLLAYILVVFNILCIKILLHTTHLWDNPSIRYLPISLELLIAPIIYFYAISLTNSSFKISKKHLWHFLPYAIFAMYSIIVYLTVLPINTIAEKDKLAEALYFNEIKTLEDILSVISAIVYWLLSYRQIVHYDKNTYLQTANSDISTLQWLRNIMALSGILIVLLGFSLWQNQLVSWKFFHVFLAGLIYYMGFRGYNINPLNIPKEVKLVSDKPQETNVSLLNPERQLAQIAILQALEQDKIYLTVELTIDSLAKSINLSPSLISSVINNELNANFRSLINRYRIDEIKQRLLTDEVEKLSIAGLAYECGFNSEASFYRVFKAIEGVSPKEFLEKHKNNDSQKMF